MTQFVLTIHTRTGHFRETANAEREGIAELLRQAANQIGSSAAATPLIDSVGHEIGRYEFGPGMINGPGAGFDQTYRNLPSVLHGGKISVPDRASPDQP